jgi:hypothetical protein
VISIRSGRLMGSKSLLSHTEPEQHLEFIEPDLTGLGEKPGCQFPKC